MKQRHDVLKLRRCEREFKSQQGNPLFCASTSPLWHAYDLADRTVCTVADWRAEYGLWRY